MSDRFLSYPGLTDFIKTHFRHRQVACFTGAGISAESGIPTFRGKGGLWEKYDPELFASTQGLISLLRNNPAQVAAFASDLYSVFLRAEPNQAHVSLSLLETKGILNCVITQNVDDLHQQAGNRKVYELHGNAFRIKCNGCAKKITLERERIKEMVFFLKERDNSRLDLLRLFSSYFPRCSCGGRFRIDVVFFSEMLPEDQLRCACRELERCKVLLIVGSSLAVYPAAGLPLYAKDKGAALIEINKEASQFSGLCDYSIRSSACVALSEILRVLG